MGCDNFRFWCQKVLPLVFDDSLSYYEVLCKVTKYINNIIENEKTITDEIVSIKNDIDTINTEINDINAQLQPENMLKLIEPLIIEVIEKMISQGLIVVSNRWIFDNPANNFTAPLLTAIPFTKICEKTMNFEPRQYINKVSFNDTVEHFKQLYNLPAAEKITLDNGAIIQNTGDRQSFRINLAPENNEDYIYTATYDISKMNKSLNGRVGLTIGRTLIYYDANTNSIITEEPPSYTKQTLLETYYGDNILTFICAIYNDIISIYLNNAFLGTVAAHTQDGESFVFQAIQVVSPNDTIIIRDAGVFQGCGVTIKDCSYIRNIDGSLFTANNRLYMTITSELYHYWFYGIISHKPGSCDFELECSFDYPVTHLYFDPDNKVFLASMKDWSNDQIGYNILTLNSFFGKIRTKNITLFPVSNNPGTDFGTSPNTEDVEIIKYKNKLYLANCRKVNDIFYTDIWVSDTTNIDLNKNTFQHYYTITDDTTGLTFFTENDNLYLLYGSSNSIKMFDVITKSLNGTLNISVDNRVWPSIATIPSGLSTELYITTFTRNTYTDGTHGYGRLAMYKGTISIDNLIQDNYIGIR